MCIFLTNKLPTEKPVFNSGPEPEPELVPVKNKATYLMRSTYIIVMHIFLTNKPPTEKATADNREPEPTPVDDKAPHLKRSTYIIVMQIFLTSSQQRS